MHNVEIAPLVLPPVNLAPFPPGSCQGARAKTDAQATGSWLAKYSDTPHTLVAYRREAERFLLWLGSRQQQLIGLAIEDVLDYGEFLKDPQPRAIWCLEPERKNLPNGAPNFLYAAAKKQRRYLANGEPNPSWKPFVAELGVTAQKHALTVLFGLGEFLAAIRYLHVNPFRAARKRTANAPAEIQRYIERPVLDALVAALERLPDETHGDFAVKERAIFTVKFLYLTGLRRDELANLTWEAIGLRRGQLWLHVNGKGNRQGDVPLTAASLVVLNRYRKSMHQGVFDADTGADGPVLRNLEGTLGVSGKTVHNIVKNAIKACGDSRLAGMSAHWLRHSAASHMLDAGVPLATVRDNMRHANISTTSGYIHTVKDKRHIETELHRI